jgi:hypothetical protein
MVASREGKAEQRRAEVIRGVPLAAVARSAPWDRTHYGMNGSRLPGVRARFSEDLSGHGLLRVRAPLSPAPLAVARKSERC